MLSKARVSDAALTIRLTDDKEMTELNHDALGKRKPTDVIAFRSEFMALGRSVQPIAPGLDLKMLGDVVWR